MAEKNKWRKVKFLENFPSQKQGFRKAIFALTYAETKKGIEYLILKRQKHWTGWEFPKGKIDRFETKRRTVRREVKEETGLKILKIKKFNVKGLYKYKRKLSDRPGIIGQTYTLFAVKVEKDKVLIDVKEHSGSEWVSFGKALKKLSWENQKRCLKIVNDWLNRKK